MLSQAWTNVINRSPGFNMTWMLSNTIWLAVLCDKASFTLAYCKGQLICVITLRKESSWSYVICLVNFPATNRRYLRLQGLNGNQERHGQQGFRA